jgi:hypothetical protein
MNAGNWIQVAVTIILVGITVWYAWETRRIVKNMERDREELHRPLLTFQLISWQPRLLKLRIQNVGSGVAVQVEGEIKSILKDGAASIPWSYPLLAGGNFEEFGFPMPPGASHNDAFGLDSIKDKIVEVRAQFKYKSTNGKSYELNTSIHIQKITEDWLASKMLVTQDHPDRIMPRIAKTLEKIEEKLK